MSGQNSLAGSGQDLSASRATASQGHLRLRTLVMWRWVAITGQTVTILAVAFGLGYDLPVGLCLAAVAASIWLNILVTIAYSPAKTLSDIEGGFYLAFDHVQLAVLLYLTGGLINPFAILFLVPVTIAATSLSLRATVCLALLTVATITFLAFHGLPLPWQPGETLSKPDVYLAGTWIALVSGLAFLGAYVWRLAEEGRRMQRAFEATQRAYFSSQRLRAIDGLAAAAAHELGTPLGTITLVARELEREIPPDAPHGEDIRLLVSQAQRCREILSRLTKAPEAEAHPALAVPLPVLLEEIAAPLAGGDVTVAIDLKVKDDGLREAPPQVERRAELMQGLSNLLENAADFADRLVTIEARWTERDVWVRLVDDGPGFPPAILDRIGEPYLTTRGDTSASPLPTGAAPHVGHDGHEGMGLGIFIAKTLLERTGADVTFANAAKGGAIVAVRWPRDRLEAKGQA